MMLLSKEEIVKLANAKWNVEIHQSKLHNYKRLWYEYNLFHSKSAFKLAEWTSKVIIISTNDDRKPIYRLDIPCDDFKELLKKWNNKDWSYDSKIRISFKDNKAFLECRDKDTDEDISRYLTIL